MFNCVTLFMDFYTTLRNFASIQTAIFCMPLKFAVRKCTGDICLHSRFFKIIYILSWKTGR